MSAIVLKERPTAAVPGGRPAHRSDFLYYGLRNKKLVFGLVLEILLVLFAIIGPVISPHNATDYFKLGAGPSARNWLGTDSFGHDIFAQLGGGPAAELPRGRARRGQRRGRRHDARLHRGLAGRAGR